MDNALAGNGMPSGSGGTPVLLLPDPVPSCDLGGDFPEFCTPATEVIACQPVSSCPPIKKNIDPQGASPVAVHEEWIVGTGGPDWSDWHEKMFMSPDWKIIDAIVRTTASPGLCQTGPWTSILPITIPSPTSELWIDLSPALQTGEVLCIWKLLEYQPTSPPQPFMIIEWPTIRTAVGGEFIPIDATAVLIAGAQSNALTILSAFVVIGAIAFGTLYFSVKRKRN